MFNTKYLSTYFTNLLNEYGYNYGKHFKIFADEGELKSATKRYGKSPIEYTSGIVEIISSQLTPVRDIKLHTYNIQITLFVDLALGGFNEDKESLNLIDIRDLLTQFISENNGITHTMSIDDKSFSQTMSFSYPTNGTKSDVGFISDCLPLYLTGTIALFQDGVNANECTMLVNGEEVSFTRVVFTRTRTADSQTFNGDTSTKTVMQTQGLSLDFVVPALATSDLSKLLMKDILNGGNYALNIKLKTPLAEKIFIGTFGNTSASLDIATNIGYNASVVEGKENILDYSYTDSKWYVSDTTEDEVSITMTEGKNFTIYWGDGEIEEFENNGTYTHTYLDRKPKHKIRVFVGG